MNYRKYIVGLIILLAGGVLISVGFETTPRSLAVAADSHADHDHGEEKHTPRQEDISALFDEDDHDDHAGHGHSGPAEDAHAGHGHGALDGICGEHNVDEAACALCQGGHIGELQPGQGMKVRLAAPDVASKAGIQLVRPQQVSLAAGVDIPGRVEFDRKQLAYITPLTTGVIRQVRVQPGTAVVQGEVLADITMPEVASLKAEFRAALAREAQSEATYHREKDLLERGISSRQEFQQAESQHRSNRSTSERYRQQLLNFGLAITDIEGLLRSGDSSGTVSLRAPFAGVVTEVNTAIGEAVSAGTALFTLADLDSLWIELAIPESKIYRAEVGATVQARFDGLPGTVFTGRIFQIGATVDERARTLTALAEVQNPGHRLKVGMFGNVRILASEQMESLAVPADAVQTIDGFPYVFIQEESDLFELRRVATGATRDGLIVIATGVNASDQVVAGQGFALKSEVLKARLGASCADH